MSNPLDDKNNQEFSVSQFKEMYRGFLDGIAPEEEMEPISKIFEECVQTLGGKDGFHIYAALLIIMTMNLRSVESDSDREFFFETLVERMRILLSTEHKNK